MSFMWDPATGRQLPESKFLPRVYRSASFSSDGSVYLGEHMCAEAPPPGIEQLTTVDFPRIPDSGVLGYGNIYRYNADWELDKEFEVENAPEPTRFKGVTHSTLHPGEQFITYTTELGKRVMRYDVKEDRQLEDLVIYPGKDISNGLFAIAVRYLPDGRLLLTRGQTMEMLDEEGQGDARMRAAGVRLVRCFLLRGSTLRAGEQHIQRPHAQGRS